MKALDMKSKDEKYIAGTYKRSDLCIESGSKSTAVTYDGKSLIDFSSGIGVNSFGYCDEGWADAVCTQAHKLQHTSNLYYTEPAIDVARLLCEKTGMKKVFFANSGAEANEGAIKVARKYSNEKYGKGRNQILTLKNSFHGRTMTTITATGQEEYHQYFHPFAEGISYVEANDTEDLRNKMSDKVCAILIELIQGEGGVNLLEKEFVEAIDNLCREKDVLLIVDEVQTGIGRTGTLFAFQQFGILPDLVTSAKGLGGGLPIGALLFGEKTEKVLVYGDHGTTFGGNPVICAGARYILEKLDETMLEEIKEKGLYIREEINKLEEVESVTGLGMMLGIRHKTRSAKEIAEECLQQGLIVLTAKDKVRLLPPLNIGKEELETGLAVLKKVLKGTQNMV